MKKRWMIYLTAILLFSFSSNVLAVSVTMSPTQKNGTILEVKHRTDPFGEDVVITLDSSRKCMDMMLTKPDRIVLDIEGIDVKGGPQTITAQGEVIRQIRYAQFNKKTARVVVDLKKALPYTVENSGQSIIIHMGHDKTSHNQIKVSGEAVEDGYAIHIMAQSYEGYNIVRMTAPDRIVMDIPHAFAPEIEQMIAVEHSLIKAVRYAGKEDDTVRIVLDTIGMPSYQLQEESKELIIKIQKPEYKNLFYHSNFDRISFTLPKIALTKGNENPEKLFTESFSEDGKQYTLSFPYLLGDLGNGILHINDGVLHSVEIKSDKEKNTTSLCFNAKYTLSYVTYYREKTNETAINIVIPALQNQRIIVIDAGHGGPDPGAVYKEVEEKKLNLDIAFRLRTLLREKKINTYMMREDDTYLAPYERAYIANALKASLFLSIHNNALNRADYEGTMTLYHPASSQAFTGKMFAQIIQNNLLKTLGTKDRKIIERPNLAVLKGTTMTAALAEIGFITNQSDRTKLSTESFRQKAAQALCDAIVESMKALGNES